MTDKTTERQKIEREIASLTESMNGYSRGFVQYQPNQSAGTRQWLKSLQARRRALMTPAEIAAEDSLPF